jgi:hypothetical protein
VISSEEWFEIGSQFLAQDDDDAASAPSCARARHPLQLRLSAA